MQCRTKNQLPGLSTVGANGNSMILSPGGGRRERETERERERENVCVCVSVLVVPSDIVSLLLADQMSDAAARCSCCSLGHAFNL